MSLTKLWRRSLRSKILMSRISMALWISESMRSRSSRELFKFCSEFWMRRSRSELRISVSCRGAGATNQNNNDVLCGARDPTLFSSSEILFLDHALPTHAQPLLLFIAPPFTKCGEEHTAAAHRGAVNKGLNCCFLDIFLENRTKVLPLYYYYSHKTWDLWRQQCKEASLSQLSSLLPVICGWPRPSRAPSGDTLLSCFAKCGFPKNVYINKQIKEARWTLYCSQTPAREWNCYPPMTAAANGHQPHLWPSAGLPAPPGTGTVHPSAGHWGRGLREPPVPPPVNAQSLEIILKVSQIITFHSALQ